MAEPKRNEPCWCGSGKKFKHCHLRRERETAMSMWEANAEFKKAFSQKQCVHPEAGNSCSGAIVRAHTVRRSADLKAIARNGHVYCCGIADLAELNKTKGKLEPALVGVNNASTFWGFCSYHDSSTFGPIEDKSLDFSPQQCFLLAYRPLMKEVYLKEAMVRAFKATLQVADRGCSTVEQMRIQQNARNMIASAEAGARDNRHWKALYDKKLLQNQYDKISSLVVEIDMPPEIMCSGVISPEFDFQGAKIQDIDDDNVLWHFVSLSLISTGRGGALVLSWHVDCDDVGRPLAESLLQLGDAGAPHGLIRLAFDNLENIFMAPDWWESLSRRDQKRVQARIMHGVGPAGDPPPWSLMDDGARIMPCEVRQIHRIGFA